MILYSLLSSFHFPAIYILRALGWEQLDSAIAAISQLDGPMPRFGHLSDGVPL